MTSILLPSNVGLLSLPPPIRSHKQLSNPLHISLSTTNLGSKKLWSKGTRERRSRLQAKYVLVNCDYWTELCSIRTRQFHVFIAGVQSWRRSGSCRAVDDEEVISMNVIASLMVRCEAFIFICWDGSLQESLGNAMGISFGCFSTMELEIKVAIFPRNGRWAYYSMSCHVML